MQLRPKNQLITTAHEVVYRDVRRKGDTPRSWSWRKSKAGRVTTIPVAVYAREAGRS